MNVICAIIKDEHQYLREWLDYHLSLGFDAIYLYEDYGSRSHLDITRDYPCVHLRKVSVPHDDLRQCRTYNAFLEDFRDGWVAFIDIDEFIALSDGLQDFLSDFEGYPSISLFWKMHDGNGQIRNSTEDVRKRFPHVIDYHAKEDHLLHGKMFVNARKVRRIVFFFETPGGVNALKESRRKKTCERAWIDHYMCRSFEEWMMRFTQRGDVIGGHRRFEVYFEMNPSMKEECMRFLLASRRCHSVRPFFSLLLS